ncbi:MULTISPECIES: hypothetical protein [unclassified Bradyrhizobium]
MHSLENGRAERVLLGIFVAFAVFAFCFQGIFYLFEYRNGDTTAPTYVKFLKDGAWTIVLCFLLYVVARAKLVENLLQPYNFVLLSFCSWMTAVKLVEWFSDGPYTPLLLALKNVVLYAAMVPLLGTLGTDTKRRLTKLVLAVLIAVAFAQAIFSAGLFIAFPEYSFWKNDPYVGFNPFVGLFSNPNRFGLFLNLGAAVLCAALMTSSARGVLLAAAGLLVLALSIFYTAALSQLLVYFGILGYATIIVAWKMRWRCLRLPTVGLASMLAIGLAVTNLKSPWPNETSTSKPREAELVWDLRNLAALTLHGKTLDGKPFRFTSDSFVNRLKEGEDLLKSFGFQNARSAAGVSGENSTALSTTAPSGAADPQLTTSQPRLELVATAPRQEENQSTRLDNSSPSEGAHSQTAIMAQRLFGRPEQLAPASQSQFAYIYFRYGLVGLLLFVGILAIPAVRSFFTLARRDSRPNADQIQLLSYHLCLVAFAVTFVGDNGLLDYPTNFLLFFVLFANQSLVNLAERRALEKLGTVASPMMHHEAILPAR